MKKINLLLLFCISSIIACAQGVSTLNENFNAACATASFPSDGWSVYNPIATTIPLGEWTCTSTNGRATTTGTPTPGMACTGVWSSSYHLDTSYLISPLLNVNSYDPSHVFLNFDTKAENIVIGARLTVEHLDSSHVQYFDMIDSIFPTFSGFDSVGWVTHQVSLGRYVDSADFYLTFRYISNTTSGTAWFLDNVNITTTSLNVPKVDKDILPLTIIGNTTSSKIELSYALQVAGNYRVVIYDMLGRQVYDGQVNGRQGTDYYTIDGLNLHPGMYCMKMGNENTYGTTKFMIQ